MLNIALVEDNEEEAKRLKDCLAQFQKEKSIDISVTLFKTGLAFIGDYKPVFDVVFMDIDLPVLSGLEVAKAVYNMDKNIAIIFCTNLAQYAIKGYEVEALDFIVKPITYPVLCQKMEKLIKKLSNRQGSELVLSLTSRSDSQGVGIVKLKTQDILYIESVKHYLVYHTSDNEYEVRGTMKDLESSLNKEGFSRCINGCLVNLRAVTKIEKDTIYVGKNALPLSRQRKKEFIDDFMRYLGKTN